MTQHEAARRSGRLRPRWGSSSAARFRREHYSHSHASGLNQPYGGYDVAAPEPPADLWNKLWHGPSTRETQKALMWERWNKGETLLEQIAGLLLAEGWQTKPTTMTITKLIKSEA